MSTLQMALLRGIFLTLCLATTLGACAIPPLELTSLLASQGVVEPSYVEQHRYSGQEGGWFVTSRDQFRQIAADICKTTERYFAVYEGPTGYRIERGAATQMISLGNCDNASMRDFATVSLPYRVSMVEPDIDELDDEALRKFVGPILALPQMAAAADGDVKFEYVEEQEDEVRTLLRRLDPTTLSQLRVYRTLDSIEALFLISQQRSEYLSVRFTYNNGRLTEVHPTAVVMIY